MSDTLNAGDGARHTRLPLWFGAAIFGVALLLGAGLKAVTTGNTYDPGQDQSARLSLFLAQNGLRVSPQRVPSHGLPGLIATAPPACEMMVLQPKPLGWDQGTVMDHAKRGDDFFYLFQGVLYEQHPLRQVKMLNMWDRVRRHVGYPIPPRPLFAVIATTGCAARTLPWQDLHR